MCGIHPKQEIDLNAVKGIVFHLVAVNGSKSYFYTKNINQLSVFWPGWIETKMESVQCADFKDIKSRILKYTH